MRIGLDRCQCGPSPCGYGRGKATVPGIVATTVEHTMTRALIIFAAGLLAGMTGLVPLAAAQNCWDLWYERNAIFDRNGYCFSTRLGQETFDNADCWTRTPNLSQGEQRRVAEIKRQEQRLGCAISPGSSSGGNSGAGSAPVAGSCFDLWYERNAIFDRNGYCFSSTLGKRTFDNSDCWTKTPNLSTAEQRRVAAIKAEENRRGCKVN
jgi:hypothetical protein